MDIIYDAEEDRVKDTAANIIYDGVPVEERRNPYVGGELELMEVDEKYRLDGVSDQVRRFLYQLRGHFADQALVTYQEVLQFAREQVMFVEEDYGWNSHPVITQWMNLLWRAGLITKYRRGKWKGVDHGRWAGQITGQNFGVTYDIW